MAKPPAQVYQIKLTLDDTHPPIWRRIVVPGDTTLSKLHDIVQIAMGWQDYHLHEFTINGVRYGDSENDELGNLDIQSEARYKLSELISEAGSRFEYTYDFGDTWDHTLLVEKIHLPQPGTRYPLCLAGKRVCPPEDVGGTGGYEYFQETIRDPDHPEHATFVEWSGGDFDPAAFNAEDITTQLRKVGRGISMEAKDAWPAGAPVSRAEAIGPVADWVRSLSADEREKVESLPLRRDALTLLTYLRDQRAIGTPSTGNLPLKAVRAICAGFVHPPELDHSLGTGEKVYRLRSETEVWPLYWLHALVNVAGLASGGPGRRWQTTPLGERFIGAEAPAQVWILLMTWWTQVNWAIASPWGYGDGQMPAGFLGLTLQQLLTLPVGKSVPFEPFAGRLIGLGRLVWPIKDQESERQILRMIVERVVINPQRDFGILEGEYGPSPVLGPEYRSLVAFQLTPLGLGLLGALRKVI